MHILIDKNRVTANVDDDIEKIKKFFADSAPRLSIEWEVITTDNDLDFELKTFSTGTFYAVKPLPLHADIVCLFYGNQPPTWTTGMTTGRFCQVPVFPAADAIEWEWKAMAHEILHALCNIVKEKGHWVRDEMDFTLVTSNGMSKYVPYWKNDLPYDPDSNYQHTLKNLEPFFNELSGVADVIIERMKDTGKETLGNLAANKNGKTFECKTLELPWGGNKRNISCIPKGTYSVTWTFSPKKLKYTYEVQSVPNRSGIRIHSSNYWTDLLGCIALGNSYADINKDGETDVLNSRITIKKFEDFMERKPFTLHII